MLRRRVALLMIGLAPLLTGCPAPTGTAAGTTTDAATAAPAAWEAEMLAALNAERAAVGMAPLTWCPSLTVAAVRHSADQASRAKMTHTGADGSQIGDRAGRAGYMDWTALGENVAYGYRSVAEVMDGWMNSPGHRANILNGRYAHVGLGRAASSAGLEYWTQDFGTGGTC